MTDARIHPRRSHEVVPHAVLIAVMAAAACFFFSNNRADPDLWGHLQFGQDIVESRRIPQFDTYSYSSVSSRWINHEWLSEVALFGVFAFAGDTGLVIVKTAVGLIVAFLIARLICERTQSIFLRLLFFLVFASVAGYGFSVRPQVCTYLFVALFLWWIERYREDGRTRWLMCMPITALVWANMHGGFVIGIGLFALFTATRLLARNASVGLVTAFVASVASTFVNPYGAGLWTFVIRDLMRARPYLPEWRPVTLSFSYSDYFALAALAIIGIALTKTRRSPYEVACLGTGMLVSFVHNRHIVVCALIMAAFVPGYIDSWIGGRMVGFEKKIPGKVLIAIFLIGATALCGATVFYGKTDPLEIEISPERFPMDAVAFIQDNGISGNLFSFFDWAQLCIRHLKATNKIFFDGRYSTVYNDSIIAGYFACLYGERDHREFLSQYPETDIMLLHVLNPLTEAVRNDRSWVKVYESGVACVFLKDNQRNRGPITDFTNGSLIKRPASTLYYLR